MKLSQIIMKTTLDPSINLDIFDEFVIQAKTEVNDIRSLYPMAQAALSQKKKLIFLRHPLMEALLLNEQSVENIASNLPDEFAEIFKISEYYSII